MEKRKNEKHGMSGTSMYKSWRAMRQRCSNPNATYYENYGGKGVKVCKEWDESFISFRDWAFANGHVEGLTIDRIDSDGDYEPNNCQWLTRAENTRRARVGTKVTFNGRAHSLHRWSEITGIAYMTLYFRINSGWSIEDALTIEVGRVDRSGDIEFEGVVKTYNEWADDLGIGVETLRQRIMDLGWSIEKALTTKNPKRGSRNEVTYKGETKTFNEWADSLGIRVDTLRARILTHKWTVERALTTPVRKRSKNKKRVDK